MSYSFFTTTYCRLRHLRCRNSGISRLWREREEGDSVRYQTNSALSASILCEETTNLASFSGIVKQLSKERDRLHRQLSLNAALEAFAGVYRGSNGIKPRRKISAKGRARIAAAQKARWAKAKGIADVPKKRTMSASARRKIAAAQGTG
jgi:hypothetical protein